MIGKSEPGWKFFPLSNANRQSFKFSCYLASSRGRSFVIQIGFNLRCHKKASRFSQTFPSCLVARFSQSPLWTHSKRWWMNRMFASQELIEFNPNTCAIDKVHFPFHSLCLLRRSRKVFFACLHAAKNRANYFPLATWVMMHFLSLSDGKKEKSYSGGEMLHINFMVRFCFRFRMANVRALQGAFCKAKQKLFRDVLHKNFSFHREQMTSWENFAFHSFEFRPNSFRHTFSLLHFCAVREAFLY